MPSHSRQVALLRLWDEEGRTTLNLFCGEFVEKEGKGLWTLDWHVLARDLRPKLEIFEEKAISGVCLGGTSCG